MLPHVYWSSGAGKCMLQLFKKITSVSILQSNYKNHKRSGRAATVHDLPEQERQIMPEEQAAKCKFSKRDGVH